MAAESGADGIHVGQDDLPVQEVREIVGPAMLVGLSTHSPAEIDAVDPDLVDYIGVGPVHETPTKPGRPAVGLELVRYAAANATVPFFAIGGLDAGNLERGGGGGRAAGVRAARDRRRGRARGGGARAVRDPRAAAARRRPTPARPILSSRDEQARAELSPLGPDERPPALLVAIVVCGLLAVGVIVERADGPRPLPPRRLAAGRRCCWRPCW